MLVSKGKVSIDRSGLRMFAFTMQCVVIYSYEDINDCKKG